MPPVMDRKSSNERCERAWKLRVAGRSWQEVADAVGFKSRQNACAAVNKWLKKNPPDQLETARRANGDGIRLVRATLFESMAAAKRANQHRTVSELGRTILESFEKEARLLGLHIAVPTEVNVTVQTMAEILTDTRARLLDVIDAEVVAEPPPAVAPTEPEAIEP